MPTYEFRCPKGHEFERFYKTMSSSPLEVTCPDCGAVAARQLSGGGGLVFKGSGFYLTDYGKNAHRGEGTKATAEGSQADGSKSEGARADGAKADSAKTDGAKTEGAKAEGAKAESAKADSAKGEGSRSDRSKSERSGSKAASPKSSAESHKPKKNE